MATDLGLELSVGDEVKVPVHYVYFSYRSTSGIIVRKKKHPIPVCTVELRTHNGMKVTVDVPEKELRFL